MKGFIHLQKLDSWSPQHAITKNGIRIECHIFSTSVVLSSTKVVGKTTYAENNVNVSEEWVDYTQCTHQTVKTWHVIVSFGDIICIKTQDGEDWAIAHESGLLLIGAERPGIAWFIWPKGTTQTFLTEVKPPKRGYFSCWQKAWEQASFETFTPSYLAVRMYAKV
jgi:hypothetical protein